MAITDEQVKAFCKAFLEAPEFATFKEKVLDGLEAAYAAQFQSEGYYAALIRTLRSGLAYNEKNNRAADAIEAVLAERDALKAELVDYKDAAASEADFVNEQAEKIRELKAERDALAARLAPVDDEALVDIAVETWIEATTDMPPRTTYTISERSLTGARAAIAAIRPHIEAAERERCAKVAEGFSSNRDWVPGSLWGNIRNEIAAAIRSGK